MKKLIIAVATMAVATVGYSGACSDVETAPVCRAWNVEMKLKTLAPKKIKCEGCDPCGDATYAYCMNDVTRILKGYIWICDYSCEDEPQFNCVVWDPKNKCSVIAYVAGEPQQVPASNVFVYGKKANQVTATLEFAGVDATGDDGLEVVASGVKGKLTRPKNGDDCYISSLTGQATGFIKYIKPGYTVGGGAGTLCEEPDPVEEYTDVAKLLPLCSACCFDGWCDAEDAPDMVPCVGTWKIRYNKKVSEGSKSIASLIPGYAL